MSSITLEIIVLLLLILANGIFAMAEMALVSARKWRLQQMADGGSRGARTALQLTESPSLFLSTVQIGITLIGIGAGAFGGATIAQVLAAEFRQQPWLAPYSELLGVAIVVIAISFLSLVLGELVPKQLALAQPERAASLVAPVMQVVSRLTAPLISLLSFTSNGMLRLLGVSGTAANQVSEEEIKSLIGEGTRTGLLEPIEGEIMERVFRLGDRPIDLLMTRRQEIVWLERTSAPREIRRVVAASGHSRFPVGDGSLDNLLGVVWVKDLMTANLEGAESDLGTLVRPPLLVPEGIDTLAVLERFRQSHNKLALVLDEFGVIQGLVTANDILEAIGGELPEKGEQIEPSLVQREDGSWLVDGMLPVDEFKEQFGLDGLPDEAEHHYQTVGGFVMACLGTIPSVGQRFQWEHLTVEVVDMDRQRVDKVLVISVQKE